MVGVQWPGIGVPLIVFGLLTSLWGTRGLAYSEPFTEQFIDRKIEERIKPAFEKFEEKGYMSQQDQGFAWIAEAVRREAPEERELERIEMKETDGEGRDRLSLVFTDGIQETSTRFLERAILDYREHHNETNEWRAVGYSLELIKAGFALQILGLIIDRVIVL